MAAVPLQEVPAAGLASVNFAAAANGDTLAVSNEMAGGWADTIVALIVRNTNAATRDVTIGGQTAITVPLTTGVSIIPVTRPGRNHAPITVVYSALTNVDVALVRFGAGY
jgi:hypothetical protein